MYLSGQLPSVSGLQQLPIHIGEHWRTFGVLLLNDETGSVVDGIELVCRRKIEDIVKKILDEWMDGNGGDVTWKILLKTLRDCELNVLADKIEGNIKGTDCKFLFPMCIRCIDWNKIVILVLTYAMHNLIVN